MLWTAAYNTTFMAGYLAIEINVFGAAGTFKGETGPRLLKAYNKNGLLVFLVVRLVQPPQTIKKLTIRTHRRTCSPV